MPPSGIVPRSISGNGEWSASPYFTPIPLQPFYAERFGYLEGDFPIMDEVCSSVLALPFYTDLGDPEQTYVARCLEEFLSHVAL